MKRVPFSLNLNITDMLVDNATVSCTSLYISVHLLHKCMTNPYHFVKNNNVLFFMSAEK